MLHNHARGYFLAPLILLLVVLSLVVLPTDAQEATPELVAETELPVTEDIPTETVTSEPTVEVTVTPTEEVTPEATDLPTQTPTAAPTGEVTAEPTAAVTEEPVSSPPVFILGTTTFEAVVGIPLTIRLSVSDDAGMVSITEETSATLGGVRVETLAPAQSSAPYITEVTVTYLAPAQYEGSDSFGLTAVDLTGEVGSVAIQVNVTSALLQPTTEPSEVPLEMMASMTYIVNNNGDAPDANINDGLCDTDLATAGSQCSLRAALMQANANVGFRDTIRFAIPGTAPAVISLPATPLLPDITDPVVIEGMLGKVVLDGGGIASGGLQIATGGAGSKISGLVIIRFAIGIHLDNTSHNTISGNYIGLAADGTTLGRNGYGIFIRNSDSNIIGGSTVAARNVISGNNNGIYLHTGSDSNIISGNYIGTDKTGMLARGNEEKGIYINIAIGNIIGGSSAGERNIISGNVQSGIYINRSSSTVVRGNYIGTNASGKAALPNNQDGILLESVASDNIIGGSSAGERNIISGNSRDGIRLNNSPANTISGNYIGTDVSGRAAVPNNQHGIFLRNGSNFTWVGGETVAARNIISGNGQNGISIENSADNTIIGNVIGLDVVGTAALGNRLNGIMLMGGSSRGNTIGGNAASRNIISGNGQNGILILGAVGGPNYIIGNHIGSDASGRLALGNKTNGIYVNSSSQTIGISSRSQGNLIAFNNEYGIHVANAAGNVFIDGNSIFSNGYRGIFLGAGANNNRARPTITTVSPTQVEGQFTGAVLGRSYRVQVFSNTTCDDSGAGEGQTFLGEVSLLADTITETFSLTSINPALRPGLYLTATVADLGIGGNTAHSSDFSICAVVATAAPTARPALRQPANNARIFNANPTFQWNAAASSISHTIEVCADSRCTSRLRTLTMLGNPPVSLGLYLADGDYYWRVRGSNAFGDGPFSNPSRFTVNTTTGPALKRPVYGGAVTDTTPTFTWAKLPGAVMYVVSRMQSVPPGDTCYYIHSNYAATKVETIRPSYTLNPARDTPLKEGRTYWCVIGYDASGNVSAFSPVWYFDVTLLKSPSDNSVTTDTTPTFTWNRAPGTGVTYELRVSEDSVLANPIISKTGLTRTSYTLTPAEALAVGKSYYWGVLVKGGNWQVFQSRVTWDFLVAPAQLRAPVLVSPANGAGALAPVNLTLDWDAVAPIVGVTIDYEVLLSDNARFNNATVRIANTDSMTFSTVAPNKRFYWKVRARYSSGPYGPFSQTRSFTTAPESM